MCLEAGGRNRFLILSRVDGLLSFVVGDCEEASVDHGAASRRGNQVNSAFGSLRILEQVIDGGESPRSKADLCLLSGFLVCRLKRFCV